MKKLAILGVSLIALFAVSSLAFAGMHHGQHNDMRGDCPRYEENGMRGGHYGAHRGHGANCDIYNSLSSEKQAQYNAINKEMFAKVTPLREQIFAKRAELQAMYNNPASEPKEVGKVAGELAALRTQMRDLKMESHERLEKELGLNLNRHCPAHNGMHSGRGTHRGMHGMPCAS